MPRVLTTDEILFAPMPPSALARAERASLGAPAAAPDAAGASTELAEGRIAVEAIARGLASASGDRAPGSLRSRIVASAGRGGKYGRYADRIARLFDLSLEDAHALLRRAEDPAQYGPGPVPDTTWMFLKPGPRYEGALAAIGRLESGSRVPDHGHGGDETTLVLDGGFVEDDGAEVWRGDELHKAKGTEHAFTVIGSEPCIAAVIVPGGVVWKERTP